MIAYQTERLILTPVRQEHEPELFKLHNDPLVQHVIFNNKPQTTEDVRNWIDVALDQWRKNGFGVWMLYEKAKSGQIFIGRCGLRDFGDTNNLEIATSLSEYGRGRGLSLEAARFAVTHALQNSTKEKIVALIKHGNTRSERATKKMGLHYIDDRWWNGKVWQYYEITREEYLFQPHHTNVVKC
ncbi:RimJ/RimL family protein N-acetyltransferase [Bradyrhizobium sp. i1.15.2]|uniref:GNAT family N-acetyltransferase n=1 Tax=Bradyrhizobium sp. i1.15.2 TaxID=3156362 RepID=UPI003393FC8F